MLLGFLLSHENMAALDDALKKINVGHAIHLISQSWIEVTATTIQNCFHQVGVNEVAIEAKQDDELAQEEEEMIQLAQEVVVEAPETVMENIPTYETLEDG
jgi:ribosome assembly protein YihI (activator of Der GTPase)